MPVFKAVRYDDEIVTLQRQLRDARIADDKAAEIAALLGIGDAALEQDPALAFAHFKLAERVIRHADGQPRLPEAIGGQGRAFRRDKKFAQAIDRYVAAEDVARDTGDTTAQVRWMLSRASVLRASGEADHAKAVVGQAEALLRPPRAGGFARIAGPINFFDAAQVAVLAELEGQHGLTHNHEHDDQAAEDHYRSAAAFAAMAEDWKAVNVWATNVGRACTRRRSFGEAIEWYGKALDAAFTAGGESSLLNAVTWLADGLSRAYRHEEGGDRLRALAGDVPEGRMRISVLHRALMLFEQGLCVGKAIETAQQIEVLARDEPVRPDFLAEVKSIRDRMLRVPSMPAPPPDGPTALDLFLDEHMRQAQTSGDVDRALQAAYLACDVRLALALAEDDSWKRLVGGDLLQQPGLDAQVVFDTVRMLLEDGQVDLAIDLLQRFKAPAFCVATLRRMAVAPITEAAAYLDAVAGLCREVDGLAGPARPDFMRAINAVRRASERMYEAGETLRAADPILAARLGAPVRKEDLIDALPHGGGVAIVDFLVGRTSTVLIVLGRTETGVVAVPYVTPSFTLTQAERLLELYAEGNLPKQLGGAQTKALMEVGKILHDNLFCGLAHTLSGYGITQLILVPDVFTRSLPLHLSLACGKEFDIPGVDTKDAAFLCEVMPVEYTSCVQAVAASQVYLRPRSIQRIAAFADPLGDLPGARVALEDFGRRSGSPAAYQLKTGAAATRAAVIDALPDADAVIFATHGVFSPGRLEDTRLVLHDEPWRVSDIADMDELQKRALIVLMACEAGAVAATPDERSAWGIPGALVASGASAVVANLWPVEDVTADLLLERFLVHLAHRGYRPAAAMFRAVRDLRRMPREEVLVRCREHLARLKANQAGARVQIGARSLLEWVEDHGGEQPFAHPYFWGATVIVGSGWHLPAGASVGPPMLAVENRLKQEQADALIAEWKPAEALTLAKEIAASSDGAARGHAYAAMALAMTQAADPSTEGRVRLQARRLLKHAKRIAASEQDDGLLGRVQVVAAQVGDTHVG